MQAHVQTADDTAIAGSDYSTVDTDIEFAPGSQLQTVDVPVIGDTLAEGDEQFTVTLSSPSHATLGTATATATGTIVDDDGAQDPAIHELQQGAPTAFGSLANWSDAFDVGQFGGVPGVAPFHLPTVTDSLASAFALHNAVQNIPAPFDTLNGSTEQALSQLEAAGLTVDWVRGAVGGRPAPPTAGDLIQVRWTTTLADLTKAAGFTGDTFDDAMQDVLAGIAQSLGLDGGLDLNGNLQITLVMGVDTSGFYVGNESGLSLDVSATGSVGGTGSAAGEAGLSIDGTGDANVDGRARRDGHRRPAARRGTRRQRAGIPEATRRRERNPRPLVRRRPGCFPLARRVPRAHRMPVVQSRSTRRLHSMPRSPFPGSPGTTVRAQST